MEQQTMECIAELSTVDCQQDCSLDPDLDDISSEDGQEQQVDANHDHDLNMNESKENTKTGKLEPCNTNDNSTISSSSDGEYLEEEVDYIDDLLDETYSPVQTKKSNVQEDSLPSNSNASQNEVTASLHSQTESKVDEEPVCPVKKRKLDDQSHQTIPAIKRQNVFRYIEPETTVDGITVASHVVTKKIVLKKRESESFSILPEGWMEATHFSGMPVYLHKTSRVCSLSKPYHLGPGSVRKHDIPLSAIPCLQYKKELDREANDCSANVVRVESVQESKKKNSLNFMSVRDYCSRLFEFQEVKIRKFKTWADRRAHSTLKKIQERPSLPEGTKLIKVPIFTSPDPDVESAPTAASCPVIVEVGKDDGITSHVNGNSKDKPESTVKAAAAVKSKSSLRSHLQGKKEFVLNPAGKSHVCVLHEFVQRSQGAQPQYTFKELENAATPYSATVIIGKTQYGVGLGSSKKIAKSEAARMTLHLLIPGYAEATTASVSTNQSDSNPFSLQDASSQSSVTGFSSDPSFESLSQDVAYFNTINILDDRVPQLCQEASQPGPYQVLVECLKRNHGLGDTDIDFQVTQSNKKKKLKNEYVMRVGKHVVEGACKNARLGKQMASQKMLQQLHPNLTSWGSLLMLYGRGSCRTPKEKREDEKHITELQGNASSHRPNFAILNKLKSEMLKVKQIRVSFY